MYFPQLYILVLTSLLFGFSYCSGGSINISEKTNYAKAANRNMRELAEEYPIDPVHKDMVVGQLSGFQYTLNDVNMTGWTKCVATLLIFNKKEHSWEEKFDCPQIVLDFDYATNGMIAGINLSGEMGTMKIKTGKVQVTIKGIYTEVTKRQKTFLIIDNPAIESEAIDNIVMDSNVSMEDQSKADASKDAFNGKAQPVGKKITEKIINDMLLKVYDYLKERLSDHFTDETLNQ